MAFKTHVYRDSHKFENHFRILNARMVESVESDCPVKCSGSFHSEGGVKQ